jgi:TPR repeat protein
MTSAASVKRQTTPSPQRAALVHARAGQCGTSQPWWLPAAAIGILAGLALLPRVRVSDHLTNSIWAALVVLLLMLANTHYQVARRGGSIRYEFVPVKAHYVQLAMHSAIYVYWGLYWSRVYYYLPLLAIQVIFLYAFDMLLCWSRRDNWTLGFGTFPIVMSTNLFLWFKDDWFWLQLTLLAVAALGKEFIRWTRNGKMTHIFNPSAFALFICSVGLLLTGATRITWLVEIAETLRRPPNIYLELFLLGIVVQALFSVTLVTLSAAVVLYGLNLLYTSHTGIYWFTNTNISASLFIGIHLLITDPATSPRTAGGKVIFGALYGAGAFTTYGVLYRLGLPVYYDKLLCVPALNLAVPVLDRIHAIISASLRRLKLSPPHLARLNPVHIAVWALVFGVMLSTGFLSHQHPGQSTEFWRTACANKGSRNSCGPWVGGLGVNCRGGLAADCTTLGEILSSGRVGWTDGITAGKALGRGCDLGSPTACTRLTEFMAGNGRDEITAACQHGDGVACSVLASVFQAGKAVPQDRRRALELFEQGCIRGSPAACDRAGQGYLSGDSGRADAVAAARLFDMACRGGHSPACAEVAAMFDRGLGVPKDLPLASRYFRSACSLGTEFACQPGERTE